MTESGTKPVVVVGVDGSQASKDALRWAAKYAALSGAEVRAVIGWHFPAYGRPVDYSNVDFATRARSAAEEAVSDALGTTPQIPVTISVIEGHPAEVLIETSRSADLLVVGSRGHGTFTRMFLGSVSQYCVYHAKCPVVVTRHPDS